MEVFMCKDIDKIMLNWSIGFFIKIWIGFNCLLIELFE